MKPMADLPVPRPFLKWAGGKTQLADELVARLPPRFGAYHEPFVGSGALFFRLFREGRISQAHLSDRNPELIGAYQTLRDQVDAVVDELARCVYNRELYYELRALDPERLAAPARTARTIYLNKTGYNGLYRVNRQGRFNVPFGRHKAPLILDERNLRAVARALNGVEIACAPYESVLERARPGDLVYLDPPYVPLSATASFTAYYPGGFSLRDQERLRDLCLELDARRVQVMLSNSDTPLTRALYAAAPLRVGEVLAARAINSDRSKRGKVVELLVTNYPAAGPDPSAAPGASAAAPEAATGAGSLSAQAAPLA
jgi:DNA adenine methylase